MVTLNIDILFLCLFDIQQHVQGLFTHVAFLAFVIAYAIHFRKVLGFFVFNILKFNLSFYNKSTINCVAQIYILLEQHVAKPIEANLK